MRRDSLRMRGDKPFVFNSFRTNEGLDAILDFIIVQGGLNA